MRYRWISAAVLFTLPFLFASCASKRPVYSLDELIPPPGETAAVWDAWLPGVERSEWAGSDPPLRVWAMRIDLQNPLLEISVTPGFPEGTDQQRAGDGEIGGRRTSTALKEFGWDLAINASPFNPLVSVNGAALSVTGLAISAGGEYSAAHEKYAAVLFCSRENGGYSVTISDPPFDTQEVDEAAGGFFFLLEDGKVDIPASGILMDRNPQTLVGLDEEGAQLFLLVVDGRQPRWSVGLRPDEAALWLAWFGANEGVMFDGGGSTTLVVRDEDGGASVVNRPVDARIIGKERVVANHLGFTVRK